MLQLSEKKTSEKSLRATAAAAGGGGGAKRGYIKDKEEGNLATNPTHGEGDHSGSGDGDGGGDHGEGEDGEDNDDDPAEVGDFMSSAIGKLAMSLSAKDGEKKKEEDLKPYLRYVCMHASYR